MRHRSNISSLLRLALNGVDDAYFHPRARFRSSPSSPIVYMSVCVLLVDLDLSRDVDLSPRSLFVVNATATEYSERRANCPSSAKGVCFLFLSSFKVNLCFSICLSWRENEKKIRDLGIRAVFVVRVLRVESLPRRYEIERCSMRHTQGERDDRFCLFIELSPSIADRFVPMLRRRRNTTHAHVKRRFIHLRHDTLL